MSERDARHLRCGSCGEQALHFIVLNGFDVPACLRHLNVWKSPVFAPVEAGWTDAATLQAKIEQARADALADLLIEVEDMSVRWQRGGGADTGWLVVRNAISTRLREGQRQHVPVREHENWWWCSCSPAKAWPVGYDEAHDRLGGVHDTTPIPPGKSTS